MGNSGLDIDTETDIWQDKGDGKENAVFSVFS